MNRAAITGGGGFIGRAIVSKLQRLGVECVVIGRSKYHDLETIGVKCFQGDIQNKSFLKQSLENVDVVFHTAAKAGIWGRWQEYYKTNVTGTQNVISCCNENCLPALVYTSTPSVVFDGKDIVDGDESLPYPTKFLCHYAKTKVMAEKSVLDLTGKYTKACAIRPHLVWGPGDPHIIPRLIERGQSQQLRIIGKGDNLVDITFIDNVASAHILAAENLLSSGTAAGKAYFIGQERPVNLWQWINELFRQLNIPQVNKKVSFNTARSIGAIMEVFHSLFLSEKEPRMTRFVAEQLAKSHYFSHSNAARDLGYSPDISINEGIDRLIHWIRKA